MNTLDINMNTPSRIENFDKLEKFNQTTLSIRRAWKANTKMETIQQTLYIIELGDVNQVFSIYYDHSSTSWKYNHYDYHYRTIAREMPIPNDRLTDPGILCSFLSSYVE